MLLNSISFFPYRRSCCEQGKVCSLVHDCKHHANCKSSNIRGANERPLQDKTAANTSKLRQHRPSKFGIREAQRRYCVLCQFEIVERGYEMTKILGICILSMLKLLWNSGTEYSLFAYQMKGI